MKYIWPWLFILFLGCSSDSDKQDTKSSILGSLFGSSTIELSEPPIVHSARKQIGKTLLYDAKYVKLSYPNGDIPIYKGVCTDVVVRALRDSLGLDLQKEIHEDMGRAFDKYPKIWGAKHTDKNIDHRRVPNLRKYFERMGWSLKVTKNPKDYKAGDIVTCKIDGRPHVMIVSSRQTPEGVSYVIHNIGWGTRENNSLFSYELDGHYRVKPRKSTSGN